MKTVKLFLSASIIILLFQLPATCQLTPTPNATLLADSLVFGGTTSISNPSLTYNPLVNKYYSLRMGGVGINFTLQTWNQSGGLPIFQDTTAMDTRGIWWNPNTNKVERNCFNTFGWSTITIDGSGNATHNFTTLFTGQHQPTQQSVGAYDYKTNTVLFNSNGTISVYNRNTATLINTFPLTGTSLATINTESVIYTGQTGYEIGVLDWVAKRVLLFNRATGVFSGMSQLPATAITHSQFRFCYANNRVWLYNSSLRKWNSYNIWTSPLPIHLVSFIPTPKNNNEVHCTWKTASEINNDYFTLERSNDGNNFEPIGEIKGAGNSTVELNYFFTDERPYSGKSYYRLKQTDYNGAFSYSRAVTVSINKNHSDILIFPNPSTDHFNISFSSEEKENYSLKLFDTAGHMVISKAGEGLKGQNIIDINTLSLPRGIYSMQFVINEKMEEVNNKISTGF